VNAAVSPLCAMAPVDLNAARQCAARGDVGGFEKALTQSVCAVVDDVLEQALPTRAKAQFLLRHADFVKGHLMEIFQRFEGVPGCAEKTAWAFENLMRRFLAHPAGKLSAPLAQPPCPGQAPRAGAARRRLVAGGVQGPSSSCTLGRSSAYMDWVTRVGRCLQTQGTDAHLPGAAWQNAVLH